MSTLNDGPKVFFTAEHRACDALWADLEAAVERRDDDGARELWTAFDMRCRRHFAMEEEVLFPALEAATGMVGGPMAVMRIEHEQMRRVLDAMASAAQAADFELVADHGDTLLMLVQQHNVKEEGVVYAMAQAVLAGQWDDLAHRLSAFPS